MMLQEGKWNFQKQQGKINVRKLFLKLHLLCLAADSTGYKMHEDMSGQSFLSLSFL